MASGLGFRGVVYDREVCTHVKGFGFCYFKKTVGTRTERQRLGSRVPPPNPYTGLWVAGNEGMDKKMETTIMGYRYIGTTTRIHSFFVS